MREILTNQRRRTDPLEAVRRLLRGETDREDVRAIRDSILYDGKLRERSNCLGVMNRDYLRARLCERIRLLAPYQRKDDFLGVDLADFDKFKLYNEAYGKVVGDVALAAVAYSISNVLPSSETGRFGGEEFVIVSNDPLLIDPRYFRRSGEKLAKAVEQTSIVVPDGLLTDSNRNIEYKPGFDCRKVTVSVGGILCDNKQLKDLAQRFNNDLELMCDEILRRADVALDVAKKGGRNRFVPYSQEIEGIRST